jgi:hypothetical protein
MTDIDIVNDDNAPEVPLLPDEPSKKVKVRKRGRITKWLAIGWLVFITVSAIGANTMPYIPQIGRAHV